MTALGIARRILYRIILSFSVIALGLSASILTIDSTYVGHGYYDVFGAFALAVSLITVIVVLPVVILTRMGRNTVMSWTGIELGWLGVLWVLWLAVGAYIASLFSGITCDYINNVLQSYCQRTQALLAFAWIIWAMMLALWIWILVVGIRANSAGFSGIWQSSAADHATAAAGTGAQPAASTYPMVDGHGTPSYGGAPGQGGPGYAAQSTGYGAEPQHTPMTGYGANQPPASTMGVPGYGGYTGAPQV